jgi:general nucleoside transport system permease protein
MNWAALFDPSVFEAMLRIATPIMLAAIGGALTHHAGIFNIALEGMMLVGAFTSVVVSYYTSSWVIAIAATIGVGLLWGLLYGLFTVRFKANFIVTGFAMNTLSTGLTTYLLRAMFHTKAGLQDPRIATLPDINFSFLDSLGVVNQIFNNQSLITYVGWIMVVIFWVLIYRTTFGLHLRAAGENNEALETAGVSVNRTRYIASLICGVLCALAGAHLALGYLNQYVLNITSGRGFIAMTTVLFAGGNPIMIFFVSLLFGFAEGFAIRLQGIGIPGYFALMIPYIITILALIVWSAQELRRRHLFVKASEPTPIT